MDSLLEKLSSGQVVAVISIVCGALVALAMIVAIGKYQLQALADEAALKRERQQADLALRERLIDRREASGDRLSVAELLALGEPPPQPKEIDAELAKRFGQLETSSDVIERELARAMATDPARKQMIVAVVDELLEVEADTDAVLAAVRPLCAPAARPELTPSTA